MAMISTIFDFLRQYYIAVIAAYYLGFIVVGIYKERKNFFDADGYVRLRPILATACKWALLPTAFVAFGIVAAAILTFLEQDCFNDERAQCYTGGWPINYSFLGSMHDFFTGLVAGIQFVWVIVGVLWEAIVLVCLIPQTPLVLRASKQTASLFSKCRTKFPVRW